MKKGARGPEVASFFPPTGVGLPCPARSFAFDSDHHCNHLPWPTSVWGCCERAEKKISIAIEQLERGK